MNTASIHTRSQTTAQAAHLFAFKPLAGHAQELMPFVDNHEHLKALELEANAVGLYLHEAQQAWSERG